MYSNPRKLPALHRTGVNADLDVVASQLYCSYCSWPGFTQEYAHACLPVYVCISNCPPKCYKRLLIRNEHKLDLMCSEFVPLDLLTLNSPSMRSQPVGWASLLCCWTPPELLDSLSDAWALKIEPHQSQKRDAG